MDGEQEGGRDREKGRKGNSEGGTEKREGGGGGELLHCVQHLPVHARTARFQRATLTLNSNH